MLLDKIYKQISCDSTNNCTYPDQHRCYDIENKQIHVWLRPHLYIDIATPTGMGKGIYDAYYNSTIIISITERKLLFNTMKYLYEYETTG